MTPGTRSSQNPILPTCWQGLRRLCVEEIPVFPTEIGFTAWLGRPKSRTDTAFLALTVNDLPLIAPPFLKTDGF